MQTKNAAWLTGLVLFAVTACAVLPLQNVEETVDPRTGTSVTKLGTPIELLATDAEPPRGDPFAYLAPFETNRMGARDLYLWVAVPEDAVGGEPPRVVGDGEPLSMRPLESGVAAEALALSRPAYPVPAAWMRPFVYAIEPAALTRLIAARELRIELPRSGGGFWTFAAANVRQADLADLASRVDAAP